MGRQSKAESKRAPEILVPGAPLEPIRVVRREITLPDGSVQVVDVPVYPPFRLEERPQPKPPTRRRGDAKPRTRRAKLPAKE
jgi:hypothetical protein